MCGICRMNGENNHFKNGSGYAEPITLFSERTEEGNPLELLVCRLHSIELFKIGERRFLNKYEKLKTGVKKEVVRLNKDILSLNYSDEPKPLRIEIAII